MANVTSARDAISECESFIDDMESSLEAIVAICEEYVTEEDVEVLQQSLKEIQNEAEEALRNLR